jgi:hypothetical protein
LIETCGYLSSSVGAISRTKKNYRTVSSLKFCVKSKKNKSVYLKKAYKPPRMDTLHCSLPLPKISCKKFQKKNQKDLQKVSVSSKSFGKISPKTPPPPKLGRH